MQGVFGERKSGVERDGNSVGGMEGVKSMKKERREWYGVGGEGEDKEKERVSVEGGRGEEESENEGWRERKKRD